ncbi:hypothetical protein NEMIN01_0752 [Nematocida minor]|uniref:uncharacterized protein n=1 Tax=Nematocida minor TaxID=1912983 RepID=UPI00221F464C|nr:uncharacterized protein NEMIN01_0752 [Nematocida minor]KAI5189889.1 hypothetical protein NEMIN01_0752 [Nematocida minor]
MQNRQSAKIKKLRANNIFMQISENSEIAHCISYNHNDKVIGLSISHGILFTCTAHYIYAWLDRESTLLSIFKIPQVFLPSDSLAIDTLIACKSKSGWEQLLSLLGKEHTPVYIFTPKGYFTLSNLRIEQHKQNHFIPHCHTSHGAFAVENSKDLCHYGRNKTFIAAIPSDDVCTVIKCLKDSLYLGMESGKILKVEMQCSRKSGDALSISSAVEKGVENCTARLVPIYESRMLPILDFQIEPMIVSHFGKRLHALPLEHKEKEQVLKIYSVHSLFIIFTASHVLLLNESLHTLCKDRIQGEGLSHSDRTFISQDSGVLREIVIASSD